MLRVWIGQGKEKGIVIIFRCFFYFCYMNNVHRPYFGTLHSTYIYQ